MWSLTTSDSSNINEKEMLLLFSFETTCDVLIYLLLPIANQGIFCLLCMAYLDEKNMYSSITVKRKMSIYFLI